MPPLHDTTPSSAENELEDRKKRAEIAKLEAEVEKLKNEQRWMWSSVRGVKITEWATAIAAIALVLSGWYSGLFSVTRERLAMERLNLEQRKEKLTAEVDTKEKKLAEVSGRLQRFEQEQEALADLRKLQTQGVYAHFSVGPEFEGLEVTFGPIGGRYNPDPTKQPAPVKNRAASAGIAAANRLRSLKGTRLTNIALTHTDVSALSTRDDLERIVLDNVGLGHAELSALRLPPSLQRLSLPRNNIETVAGFKRLDSLAEFGLQHNPVGDDGIAGVAVAFPNLSLLNLCGTDVTDKGVSHISKLHRLVCIDLRRTRVTSKGLLQLLECPLLHVLRADGHLLTDEIRSAMRAKNEHLHIQGDVPFDIQVEDKW